MKISGVLFVFLLFGFAGVMQAQKTIPSVAIKTLDGQSVDIQDFVGKGKVTVLSFWATWCAPCKKELDAVADLYEDWKKDYNVELIAISIDDQRALPKVKPMVASKGWPFTVLTDVNQALRIALNFQTVPQTFLVDGQGKVVWAHSGYVPGDEYELEDQIKALKK